MGARRQLSYFTGDYQTPRGPGDLEGGGVMGSSFDGYDWNRQMHQAFKERDEAHGQVMQLQLENAALTAELAAARDENQICWEQAGVNAELGAKLEAVRAERDGLAKRLGEADGLLRHFVDRYESGERWTAIELARIIDDTQAFLAATPPDAKPETVLVRRVDVGTALGIWEKFYSCNCSDCQEVKARLKAALGGEMTDADRTIVRVLTKDLEALQAAFPNVTCPYCQGILFGLPQTMVEVYGRTNSITEIYFRCQPCGQLVGYNPITCNVWQAAEDTRTPWPGVEITVVDPL